MVELAILIGKDNEVFPVRHMSPMRQRFQLATTTAVESWKADAALADRSTTQTRDFLFQGYDYDYTLHCFVAIYHENGLHYRIHNVPGEKQEK